MRWFVETSSIGKSDPAEKVCVEAAGWQQALQHVRGARGHAGSFASFSIELLDDGYRAIDPATRTRFVIHRAPDDAAVTAEAGPAPPAKVAATNGKAAALDTKPEHKPRVSIPDDVVPRAPQPPKDTAAPPKEAPAPPTEAAAPPTEAAAAPKDAAPSKEAAPPSKEPATPSNAAATAPKDAAPSKEPATPSGEAPPSPKQASAPTQVLVEHRVASERAQDPTPSSPLTYRELAVVVAPATRPEELEALLRSRFEALRATVADRKHRYVVIAAFDHDFHGSPDKMPVATLSWKDWRSPEPEVRVHGDDAPPPSVVATMGLHGLRPASGSAAPVAPPEPEPSAPANVPRSPDSIQRGAAAMAGDDEPTIVKPDTFDDEPAPAPAAAAPPVPAPPPASQPPASAAPRSSVAPARETMTPPPVPEGQRVKGVELLSELFDASGDLALVHDALDGADFVLALALGKIPCEAGVASFFDMNKRSFVVVRQRGGKKKALLAALPERAEIANRAMRGGHAVVVPEVAAELDGDGRWGEIGVAPRSLVCAPVLLGGRYLGLIELVNPLDGQPFDADDGNALDYLGQQLADFLATRPITVDPETVKKAPLRSRMR
jgi:hypothetical protein